MEDHQSLRGRGNALIVLLSIRLTMLAAQFGLWIALVPRYLTRWLDGFDVGLTVLTMVVLILWLRRARSNAEASGWPQRYRVAWAFWGWFVPVVNLWIPFRMMADVWRASLPEDSRRDTAWLPGLCWTCWLLGSLPLLRVRLPGRGFHLYLTHSPPFWPTAALAAAIALLIVIVGRVTDSPIG